MSISPGSLRGIVPALCLFYRLVALPAALPAKTPTCSRITLPVPSPCDSLVGTFYSLLSEGNFADAHLVWRLAPAKCGATHPEIATMQQALVSTLKADEAALLQHYIAGKAEAFEAGPFNLAAKRMSVLRSIPLLSTQEQTQCLAQQSFWRALALASRNDPASLQAALDSLLESQRLVPNQSPVSNAIGEVLIRLERYPEALAVLSQATKNAPSSAFLHENRGIAFIGLEQYDSAALAFTRCLALDPARIYLKPVVTMPKVYFISSGNLFFIKKTNNEPLVEYNNFVNKIKENTNGMDITLVHIPQGSFVMGNNTGQADVQPAHTVTLSDYYLSEAEITTAQWEVVMGYSYRLAYETCRECPVTSVSWDELRAFFNNLNKLTHKAYRLPTEAEWEYAAGGGSKNRTLWAGSPDEKNLNRFARYAKADQPTPYPVKGLFPNTLGLYDMSGNVWEWCQDWYTPSYAETAQDNPTGPATGQMRVLRGGSWNDNAANLMVSTRSYFAPNMSDRNVGFRIALPAIAPSGDAPIAADLAAPKPQLAAQSKADSDTTPIRQTVKGIAFALVPIPGGTFQMGGTSGDRDEEPEHTVALRGFYLGETELTWAVYKAVTGIASVCDSCPVDHISQKEVQAFILRLNALTGKTFRLPTEAEWEYAAGGGNNARTHWAGAAQESDLEQYAWFNTVRINPVKRKRPNQLGLYDMSGNVWEWCQDWYGGYAADPQTNPTGAPTGFSVVYRGGAWSNDAATIRVNNRSSRDPNDRGSNIGFRLALTSE